MVTTYAVGTVAAALLAPLQPRYKFVRVLGTGANAIVSEAIDTNSGEKVAIKVMQRMDNDLKVQSEVAVLGHARHPNCIRLLRLERTPTHIYLIMELCSGGELFERIMQDGPINEADAKHIAQTLFRTIAHLHAKGIMHRDLKLENILFSKSSGLDVKIVDFGLATMSSRAHDVVGSLQYMAPEIALSLDRGYAASADCWSLGIILHGIILGFLPYSFDDTDELEKFARGAAPPVELFGFDECARLSPGARDLLSKLLVADPQQRLSAEHALAHPWLKGATADSASIRPTKRKTSLVEATFVQRSPSPSKRRRQAELFNNLFPESPNCATELSLGPPCDSLEALQLPACQLDGPMRCFERPERQLFDRA